jgi:protein-tyrosine kinase
VNEISPVHTPSEAGLTENGAFSTGPNDRRIDETGISPKLVALSEHDIHARAFKLLRTTLNRQVTEHGYQVIGVTSCAPNAGKSFIASNLAASMSRLSSRKTMLVDLDLQRASIAELFGIPDQDAVSEYLLGSTSSLEDICWTLGDSELTVVPTFLRKVNSAELLSGERYATFMSELRQLADKPLIICDLPPMFVSDDALLAAQQLDGVLVVVEQGVTTRKQLEAALRMLYPTKLIGTVFNRSSGGLGDPYGYTGRYGAYYK